MALSEPLAWDPGEPSIDYLLGRGRIERTQPSVQVARQLLSQAGLHVASARILATTPDATMAFAAAYDAARKALTAILATQGLRPKAGDGGHLVLLDVLRPQFPSYRKELLRFDWLRTVRNGSQYPDIDTAPVTAQDIEDAIMASCDIVQLARAFLATRLSELTP